MILLPSRSLYLGLFLITLSTLLVELALTRLFSVLMYYHMAFFAVSVTLFGIAFGGAIVHFLPRWFTPDRAQSAMAWSAVGFALSLCAALALLINLPFDLTRNRIIVAQCFLVGLALSVPFTFGGIAVAVALTRFLSVTHRLYGWDLAGAALGCLLFAPLIYWCGGPRLILLIALLLALVGLLLFITLPRRNPALLALIGLLCFGHAVLVISMNRLPIFQMRQVRGGDFNPNRLVYDKWNAISRITAFPQLANSFGLASPLYSQYTTDQLTILIDTFAATPIIHLPKADYQKQFFPFHDISYAAHAIIKDANVAVIGVGGGRDILAAKAWGQPRVTGIEINGRTFDALTRVFADYAGNPQSWPGVRLVKDEARSFIARSPEKFDIIQASLIDTFAATSAGAFVLTENSLYTLEGWKVFLDHLTDRGVLTMTRWYITRNPVETLRLVALARAALERHGIRDIRRHLLLARTPDYDNREFNALATILVKKTPFTVEEAEAFNRWTQENFLLPLITPQEIATPELAGILNAPDVTAYTRRTPFDLSPPTDNKPFFFDVLRWRDIFDPAQRQGSDYMFSINMKPLVMLGSLLASVIALAFIFIAGPLWWESRRTLASWPRGRKWGMVGYFVMLGLGYMMVELTLLQRLSVFLGHPGYSLMVCLFTLLLSSGMGAMAAPHLFRRKDHQERQGLRRVNLLVFGVQLITLGIALYIVEHCATLNTPWRLLIAGLLLAPAGFLMGMPFPLAIQAAAQHRGAPLAWFWGINGVASVCASVLVIALGHSFGLIVAFVLGTSCYLLAAVLSSVFTLAEVPRASKSGA